MHLFEGYPIKEFLPFSKARLGGSRSKPRTRPNLNPQPLENEECFVPLNHNHNFQLRSIYVIVYNRRKIGVST